MSLSRSTTVDEPSAEPDEGARSEDTEGTTTRAADAADTEGAAVELPLDQVFEVVKNERRRLALQYLREQDEEVTLGELAEHIAAIENDTTVAAISSKQRKRVYVGLYQCHLPKMDDLDVVEFNQNRGRIELGPNAERLYQYIGEEETQTGWSRIYLAIAATGGLLLAGSVLGLAAVGLTPTLVAGMLVVSLGCCSVLHTTRQRREE